MSSWHMRRLCDFFIGGSLLATVFMGCAQAEDFKLLPKAEQIAAKDAIVNAYKKSVLPFAKAKTANLSGRSSAPQIFLEQSAFVWDLDGEKFVAMVGAVSDDVSPLVKCDSDPSNPFDDKCNWARWRSSACYLFVNKMSGEIINAYRIKLHDRAWGFHGRPRCSGVLAVSESRVKPEGMLLILRFGDSMADADAGNEAISTTDSFLFVPVKHESGVSFVQSDECLARQSEASTVAKARGVLKACAKN